MTIDELTDSLEVVEAALVARCQFATDDNIDLRSALLEIRCVLADLKASGRPTKEDSPWGPNV